MKIHYMKDEKPIWEEWKLIEDCTDEEKEIANLRTIEKNEIVLDIDKVDPKQVIDAVDSKGFSYKAYSHYTDGRICHIHLIFPELKDFSDEEAQKIKKLFIERHGCDTHKVKDLIALEDKPHFKGQDRTTKRLVKSKDNGVNKLPVDIIRMSHELPSPMMLNVVSDISLDDPVLQYVLHNKMQESTERNNILFKNLAIMLVRSGLNDIDVKRYVNEIVNNCDGKTVGEFMGWIEKAKKGEIDDFNKAELNKWIDRHNLSIPKYELNIQKNSIKKGAQNVSVTEKLIRIGEGKVKSFFLDQFDNAFAEVVQDKYNMILPLESKKFRDLLAAELYAKYEKGAFHSAIDQAISTFRGRALQNSRRFLYTRCHLTEDNQGNPKEIIYDLTRNDWTYVRIASTGFELAQSIPITFYRHFGTQDSQVLPEEHDKEIGYYFDSLRPFTNITDDDDWLLLKTWIVCSYIDCIPRPALVPFGSAGSAKSTTCRFLKELIDPCSIKELTLHKRIDDLLVMFSKHYFVSFDNVSYINSDQSDEISKAITGSGSQKRALFTNADTYTTTFKRAIAINGVNNVLWKTDLIDRALCIELERINPLKRLEERVIERQFRELKPKILYDIFIILSKTLSTYPDIKLKFLPRMADFTKWGEAVSQAMGYPDGMFAKIYQEKLMKQNAQALSSSIVSQVLLKFFEKLDSENSSWEGSPTDFYKVFTETAAEMRMSERQEGFPRGAQSFSRRVNELRANFKDVGIDISHRTVTNNRRQWCVSINKEVFGQYVKGEETKKRRNRYCKNCDW